MELEKANTIAHTSIFIQNATMRYVFASAVEFITQNPDFYKPTIEDEVTKHIAAAAKIVSLSGALKISSVGDVKDALEELCVLSGVLAIYAKYSFSEYADILDRYRLAVGALITDTNAGKASFTLDMYRHAEKLAEIRYNMSLPEIWMCEMSQTNVYAVSNRLMKVMNSYSGIWTGKPGTLRILAESITGSHEATVEETLSALAKYITDARSSSSFCTDLLIGVYAYIQNLAITQMKHDFDGDEYNYSPIHARVLEVECHVETPDFGQEMMRFEFVKPRPAVNFDFTAMELEKKREVPKELSHADKLEAVALYAINQGLTVSAEKGKLYVC